MIPLFSPPGAAIFSMPLALLALVLGAALWVVLAQGDVRASATLAGWVAL